MLAESRSSAPVERVYQHPLRPLVRWVGATFAPRCPRWLAPETIACSGFGLAALAAAALHLAGRNRWWFVAAVVGLALQQLADWVDGSVARHRGLASDHGMLLDIFIDDLSFTVIFLGLASASYANFAIIALSLIVYLLNDTVLNLRIHFQGRHLFPFISPAEVSALLIVGCALTFLFPRPVFIVRSQALGWFDAFAVPASIYGIVEMLVSVRRLYVELVRESR